MQHVDFVVTIDELARRYEGALTQWRNDYLIEKLADSQDFIDNMLPQTYRRLAEGRLSRRAYSRIVCEMTLRVLRNTDGLASEGDQGYSYSRLTGVASGLLQLTADDMQTLTGVGAGGWLGMIPMGLQQGWQ